ncbi:MAG: hypothetical protein AAB511_02340 [Patescibacteria group bacterium]
MRTSAVSVSGYLFYTKKFLLSTTLIRNKEKKENPDTCVPGLKRELKD